MSKTRPTTLPDIPEDDRDGAIEALKEVAEVGLGRRGDPLDKTVTFRDLKAAGLGEAVVTEGSVSFVGNSPSGGGGGGTDGDGDTGVQPPDFGQQNPARPPAPSGVSALGVSLDAIMIRWDAPNYFNHGYAEVFASYTDNIALIFGSFNSELPVSNENLSEYFMGQTQSTQYIHQNMGATVPSIQTDFTISAFTYKFSTHRIELTLNPDVTNGTFTIGDLVTLHDASGLWLLSGERFTVSNFTLDGSGNQKFVELTHETLPQMYTSFPADDLDASDDSAISGFRIRREFETDDELDAALTPYTVYYWVRFVSTARVPGLFQDDAGVPGTVMLNPDQILNVLTGRVRESQLANSLLTPIDFVRGPMLELNPDGSRRYPTIRSFVEAEADLSVSEYDEELERIILGYLGGDFAQPQVMTDARIQYESPKFYESLGVTNSGVRVSSNTTEQFTDEAREHLENVGVSKVRVRDAKVVSNTSAEAAALDVWLDYVNGREFWAAGFSVLQLDIDTEIWFANLVPTDFSVVPEAPGGLYILRCDLILPLGGDPTAAYDGIAAAAVYLSSVTGEASANSAYLQSLQLLSAGFEEGNQTGIKSIISTVADRALVEASDSGAIALIDQQVGILIEDGSLYREGLNQTLSQVTLDQDDRLINSWTVRLQQRSEDGILTTAGFGLSLESGLGEEPKSSFIISADEFAVMGGGQQGTNILALEAHNGGALQVVTERSLYAQTVNGFPTNEDEGFTRATHGTVLLTIPPDPAHPLNAMFTDWRGVEWYVETSTKINLPSELGVTFSDSYYRNILIPKVSNSVSQWFTPPVYQTLLETDPLDEHFGEIALDEYRPRDDLASAVYVPGDSYNIAGTASRRGSAVIRAPSIPFIIDTNKNVVAIRGTLVVDGLISADEVEVNRLLRANQILAQGIITHGLAANQIITDKLATYDAGGWALVMNSPDPLLIGAGTGKNPVLRLAKYAPGDRYTEPEDLLEAVNDGTANFPQFSSSPIQTNFSLDANTGSVFMKGALRVGSGARIVSDGTDLEGSYGVLMDRVFPLMVYDRSVMSWVDPDPTNNPFFEVGWAGTAQDFARRNALFYCNADGTAGFNTANDAIFIDGEPLAMPSSGPAGVMGVRELGRPGSNTVRLFASCSVYANTGQITGIENHFVGRAAALCLIPNYSGPPAVLVPQVSGGADPYPGPMPTQHMIAYMFGHAQLSWTLTGVRDVTPGTRYSPVVYIFERFSPQGETPIDPVAQISSLSAPAMFCMQVSKAAGQFGATANNRYTTTGKVEDIPQFVASGEENPRAIVAATFANGDPLDYADDTPVNYASDI